MKYKMYVGNILKCTEYNVVEVKGKKNSDDFSKGYRVVRPVSEVVEEKALLIKISNGKFLRYTDTMGLNNVLNKLRLYQSDGPSVLQQQGYILKDSPTKQGDIYVDTTSLEMFNASNKNVKTYMKKKRGKLYLFFLSLFIYFLG